MSVFEDLLILFIYFLNGEGYCGCQNQGEIQCIMEQVTPICVGQHENG